MPIRCFGSIKVKALTARLHLLFPFFLPFWCAFIHVEHRKAIFIVIARNCAIIPSCITFAVSQSPALCSSRPIRLVSYVIHIKWCPLRKRELLSTLYIAVFWSHYTAPLRATANICSSHLCWCPRIIHTDAVTD